MICLDANQGIFPLPCEFVEITAKCTQIISTISILAADSILTPPAATVVATYVMIDKCANKFNTIYMCVYIVDAWALGLWKINH